LTNHPTAIPVQQAVLAGACLAGEIVSSGAWTAHLRLVTDPDFKINAFVYRLYDPGRPRTIEAEELHDGKPVPISRSLRPDDPAVPVNLAGDLTGLISAEVPARHGIRPGDHVRTMGDDIRLPVGVFIGYVLEVTPSAANPKHVRLRVAPALDLQSLRDVYVVVPLASGGT
jgi:cell shape-determining protein MreC